MISVLMSVYNCEKTLRESVECLLAQTESDWELILCDDGSSDDTWSLVCRFAELYPEKIHPIRNQRNIGLAASLNRCLLMASGEVCARMDGDDRCSADRFEKELSVFSEYPECHIVSCDMTCFDEQGTWGLRQYPDRPHGVDFVHGTPFCHAAAMLRTDALRAVGGYSEDPHFERVEDYELWLRMEKSGFHGVNLHEPLYQMRDDRDAVSRRKMKYRVNEARVRLFAVLWLKLPPQNLIYVLRPLLLGLVPRFLYEKLHRRKLSGRWS